MHFSTARAGSFPHAPIPQSNATWLYFPIHLFYREQVKRHPSIRLWNRSVPGMRMREEISGVARRDASKNVRRALRAEAASCNQKALKACFWATPNTTKLSASLVLSKIQPVDLINDQTVRAMLMDAKRMITFQKCT